MIKLQVKIDGEWKDLEKVEINGEVFENYKSFAWAEDKAYVKEPLRTVGKIEGKLDIDEPIQSDACYEFNGELICPECLVENHRKRTDDYVE